MTANVETAVINYLLAGAAITTIVGTRVYPVARPQGSPLPAITVTRISGGPLYADDGEVGLDNARLQVDSWGTTYAAAKDLAMVVGDRLSAVRDVSQSGVTIRYAMLDAEQDLRESGADEYEYLFRTRQDYIVWTGG
jgi:hypothetical protein